MRGATKDYFLLREGLINLNHGSFGTVPKIVLESHYKYLLEQESCPEIWFRDTYFKYVNAGRQAIADLTKSNVDDIVLVENASYAINSVLRSFPFKSGDKLVLFSCAYKMVVDTISFLVKTVGIEMIIVPIQYPLTSEAQLLDAFTHTMNTNSNVKMCIFSHISSMPSMIKPVQALTKIAKDCGSLVMIDGAHAPGVLDIDVNQINADFYTGNCHKWLFAPKGTAFLWVSRSQQSDTCPQPVVISSSGKYDFVGRFEYTGTRDYTPFASIPAAFSFVEEELGGMQAMRKYNKDLILKASRMLIREWNTGYLVAEEMVGFMSCVILPCNDKDILLAMQQHLMQEFQLSYVYSSVPAESCTEGKEIFFVRLSAQVYLEMKDFEKLGVEVKNYLKL